MTKTDTRSTMMRCFIAVAQMATAVTSAALAAPINHALGASDVGNIAGTVFQDYNGNGVLDTGAGAAIDRGIAGVQVTVVNVLGQSATIATDGNGAYTIATPGSGPYRVEFTNLPAGFKPSARSAGSFGGATATTAGSSVQFVNEGGVGNVNLAINNPADYCQNNPTVATCNMWQGNQISGANKNEPVLRAFPNSAGAAATVNTPASYDAPASTLNVPAAQLGATFGLGYDRVRRKVFVASYFKRHAGFGPNGGAAIYRVNAATGAVESTISIASAVTGNPHDTSDFIRYNTTASFDLVGKTSFGGLAVAEDGGRVFVMNLATRALHAIDAATGAPISTQSAPLTGIATATGRTCAADDVRPFAVEYYRGSVYVGAVCSAQSTANLSDLYAIVWRVDPATLAFGTPVFRVPLNYSRGYVDDPTSKPAEWNAWATTFPTPVPAGTLFPTYPQPMLTGIQFDRNGDMILALRDRFGDQTGNQAPSAFPPTTTDYTGITAGDLLRACASSVDAGGNATAWSLESNGRCGLAGAGPTTGNAPNGTPLSAQGPDGGEFYAGDGWYPTGDDHDEVVSGGALQLPGYAEAAATTFNPIPGSAGREAFDSGIRWMSNSSGALTRAYRLVNGEQADGRTFAKANGIGELIALCDAAPIELGNRIWDDANGNGVQDPNERGLNGTTVQLFAKDGAGNFTVLAGTSVTSGDGEYYFVSGASADPNTGDNIGVVNGGVLQNTEYQVRAVSPANKTLSPVNSGSGANADAIDSDATASGANAVIAVTTGGPGANDHTLDIGFAPLAPKYAVGNRVWIDSNNSGVQEASENGVQATVRIYGVGTGGALTQIGADKQTDANGYYCFDNLDAGNYVLEAVTPVGYASSTVNAADPNNDQDQDDNGAIAAAGNAVRSGQVTLGPGAASEPANEADPSPAGAGCATSALPDNYKNETVDFGFYRLMTLGNQVFIDSNNSGTKDGAEAGLPGVTVRLYRDSNNDGTVDGAAIATTTTGADGLYLFSDLSADTYIVEIVTPTGYTSSTGGGSEPAPDADIDADDNDDNGTTAGAVIRSAPVTLTPGGEPVNENPADTTAGNPDNNGNMTVDFGLVPPVLTYALGNRVWVDADNSGSIDAADGATPGLNGATVRLYAANVDGSPNGPALQSTTTANGGYYCFSSLGAGDYLVEVVTPAGYASSTINAANPNTNVDSDDNGAIDAGAAVRSGRVSLGDGAEPLNEEGAAQCAIATGIPDDRTNLTVDFGFFKLLSLGNHVFNDVNNNGVKDVGDTGVAGITVRLLDATNTVISTTVTDGGGNYRFVNLRPGDYAVEITNIPAGFASSTGSTGQFEGANTPDPDNNVDNDDNGNTVSPGVIRTGLITLSLNGENNDGDADPNNNPSVDFGIFSLKLFLGDYVWLDLNKNGLQDANEPGVKGVAVRLFRDDNRDGQPDTITPLATQITDDSGKYLFNDLVAGNYVVEFVAPSGYALTTPRVGGDTSQDSNADPITGRTPTIPLLEGSDLTIDAGLIGGSLGNYVWRDNDRDGQQDPDEAGVPNVVVSLRRPDGSIITTTTDANGGYLFTGLPAGTYYVTFTLPVGLGFTLPNIGGDGLDSDAGANGGTGAINLSAGQENLTVDAGVISGISVVKSSEKGKPNLDLNDEVTYSIVVTNLDNKDANNVIVTDPIPANTAYVAGSAVPTPTSVNPLRWTLNIPAGGSRTVSFKVKITSIPATSPSIKNKATVVSGNLTIDSNEVVDVLRPTAITLASFTAQAAGQGATVVWETTLEQNSLGFNVWRSASADRGAAQKVNAAMVAAVGSGSGARYEVADVDATAGAYYWLEEVELNGNSLFYGPTRFGSTEPVLSVNTNAVVAPVAVVGGVQAQPAAAAPAPAPAVLNVSGLQSVAPAAPVQAMAAPQAQALPSQSTSAAAQSDPVAAAVAAVMGTSAQQRAPVAPAEIAAPVAPVEAVASSNVNAPAAPASSAAQVVAGAQSPVRVLRGAADADELATLKAKQTAATVSAQSGRAADLALAGVAVASASVLGLALAWTMRRRAQQRAK